MKKLISLVLCLTLVALMAVPSAFALDYKKNMTAKIGLIYGSEAKDSYNVLYDAGGMDFGWLDSNDNPVIVYESGVRFVAVANDKSYGLSGNALTFGSSIGAYHVQLDNTFPSQGAAYNEAAPLSGFVAYVEGAYRVRFGSYQTLSEANDAAAQYSAQSGRAASGAGGTSYGFSVVDLNEGRIIFELEQSGVGGFYLSPVNKGAKPVLKNGSTEYYGSFLMYRNSSGKLNLINVLPVQDYLKGVVPNEMSNAWPIEALKAQAVAARNYLYQNINKHKGDGFMVCDSTHCQVYGGTARAGKNSDAAVDQTDGMVLTYGGKLAELYYHASSGGYTENSENIWFAAVPYLTAVESPYEDLDNASYGRWSTTLTKEEVRAKLVAGGYTIGEIESFYVSQYTDAGNVYSVTATDTEGRSVTISKETARLKLSPYVHSQRFTITGGGSGSGSASPVYARSAQGSADISDKAFSASVISGSGEVSQMNKDTLSVKTSSGDQAINKAAGGSNADGTYTISGTGFGNNVGMSQEGAKGMALQGYTFDQILTHYFRGTKLDALS
ncbi:MAG: SpoIID/LytB domain-containing protein [Clostridia bacterium]|nr:SpoIID/LytB domain-containing protein [Clostridia bacterium]